MKEQTKRKFSIEILVFLLYIVGVSVISYFHEPWFDEAQAWQIARSASIKDILFKIPHWEGHPQLWHLLLVPFAKLGAPYLFSLKFVNIVMCSAAVYLLIFKSPFPKLLKCTLPFTYFLFYQYGVLSRPYSLFMLAIFFMAVTYKKRNEKPLPFALSMALLCSSQMYGIIIAGMVSVVWVVKIFASYTNDKKGVLKDRRCYVLLGLLVLAAFIIISVIPNSQTYNYSFNMSLIDKLKNSYTIFFLPFEAFWGMFLSYEMADAPTLVTIILECFGGLAILAFIFYYGKKTKMISEFFAPCVPLLIFMTLGYSSPHHSGIITLFFIYWFWIMIDENGTAIFTDMAEKIRTKLDSAIIRKLVCGVMAAALILPIAQSVVSSIYEVKYPYSYSKQMSEYIKEHDLQDLKILSEWQYTLELGDYTNKELKCLTFEQMKAARTDLPLIAGVATELSPYFDKNIFMNFGNEDGSDTYTQYRKSDDPEADLKKWHDKGLPDIIISEVDLKMIYSEEELDTVEYVRIAKFNRNKIFKFTKADYSINLYMRKDLLDKYGLKELPF